ncbi:MAG TPA: efflux transporter outer membrane subunit, partial [Stellaceae bacterium]|nr:efflux transporter outer membrane subunit [Stellaceae bacterium]
RLPVSLPSELVRQRPDVLAAEATLHQASAEIGVATAALLPNVALTGSYGVNNGSAAQLFSAGSRFWSFGADMTQPIFEGGTLWEKRKAAFEGFNQAKASYRQTVLAAFAQVADTLRGLEHDAEVLKADDQAMAAADQSLSLVQANYAAGIATYLDVLTADAQDRQAKIADLQALGQRYQDTVAMFTALGGGWWAAEQQAEGTASGTAPGP